MDEEQKKAIMEKRTANRKIAEMVREGPRYHEGLKLRLADGVEHEVAVYALSTGEIRGLFEEYSLDLKDLGDRSKLTQNMRFMESIAVLATGQDEIADIVLGAGCADIMQKCFEISSLTDESSKKVESFQPRDLQPEPIRAD